MSETTKTNEEQTHKTANKAEHFDDVMSRFGEVWQMMSEKGLSLSEKMRIRHCISEWARLSDPNIEQDHKYNIYRNKNFKGYNFSTEKEAEFIGAMFKYFNTSNNEKIIQVFAILNKLMDGESDYKFTSQK